MKNILLASTAIVAFGGAAFADGHTNLVVSGDATLGYNSDITQGNEDYYYDANLNFAGSTALDNGLTAAFTVDASLSGECDASSGSYSPLSDGNSHVCWNGYELSLTSDTAGLYFGDTDTAAEPIWDGISGSEVGGFDEVGDNDEEAILRGELTFGDISAYLSYGVDETSAGQDGDFTGMQFAATATLGTVDAIFAYQDADNTANDGETFGLQVGTTLSGADVKLAYIASDTTSSVGVEVGYAFDPVNVIVYVNSNSNNDASYGVSASYATGPISATAFFDNDQGTDDWGVEGSYDLGNGLMVMAGVTDSGEDAYLSGTYDLGGGASVLMSFATDNDGDAGDEVGDPEYQVGTTVELTFAF